MPRTPADRLIQQGAALLAEYLREGRTRTDLLKEVARIIVDLRASHHLEDGRQDWSGRSTEYRREVREMYERAHVPHDYRDTLQTALRYHVGNLLRERAEADDLASVGLTTVSPKERLSRDRELLSALMALQPGGRQVDPVRAVAHAVALLEIVEVAGFPEMSAEAARALRVGLEAVQGHAAELLVALLTIRPESARQTRAKARKGKR